MRRRRKRIVGAESKGFASRMIDLSLFFLLLSFFIVLNSISSYEDNKSKNILESLEYTFATQIVPRGSQHQVEAGVGGSSIYDGDTIDQIQALFRSQLPGDDATVDRVTGILRISVSRDVFEKTVRELGQRVAPETFNPSAATANDTAGRFEKYFLPTLVAMLRSEKQGDPFRIDVMYNIAGNPARIQRVEPQILYTVMNDVNAMARLIKEAGLPDHQIVAGVQEGNPGKVDLYFSRYQPFSADDDDFIDGDDE